MSSVNPIGTSFPAAQLINETFQAVERNPLTDLMNNTHPIGAEKKDLIAAKVTDLKAEVTRFIFQPEDCTPEVLAQSQALFKAVDVALCKLFPFEHASLRFQLNYAAVYHPKLVINEKAPLPGLGTLVKQEKWEAFSSAHYSAEGALKKMRDVLVKYRVSFNISDGPEYSAIKKQCTQLNIRQQLQALLLDTANLVAEISHKVLLQKAAQVAINEKCARVDARISSKSGLTPQTRESICNIVAKASTDASDKLPAEIRKLRGNLKALLEPITKTLVCQQTNNKKPADGPQLIELKAQLLQEPDVKNLLAEKKSVVKQVRFTGEGAHPEKENSRKLKPKENANLENLPLKVLITKLDNYTLTEEFIEAKLKDILVEFHDKLFPEERFALREVTIQYLAEQMSHFLRFAPLTTLRQPQEALKELLKQIIQNCCSLEAIDRKGFERDEIDFCNSPQYNDFKVALFREEWKYGDVRELVQCRIPDRHFLDIEITLTELFKDPAMHKLLGYCIGMRS